MTDVNILDVLLEKIWDPLDDVVFVLIGLAGLYRIGRIVTGPLSLLRKPAGRCIPPPQRTESL